MISAYAPIPYRDYSLGSDAIVISLEDGALESPEHTQMLIATHRFIKFSMSSDFKNLLKKDLCSRHKGTHL